MRGMYVFCLAGHARDTIVWSPWLILVVAGVSAGPGLSVETAIGVVVVLRMCPLLKLLATLVESVPGKTPSWT